MVQGSMQGKRIKFLLCYRTLNVPEYLKEVHSNECDSQYFEKHICIFMRVAMLCS